MRVTISFDYDSPAGHRQSWGNRDCPPDADQVGTEALLQVLADYRVRATFGVVGHAALPGSPPEHCQDQIRRIHLAGHEICSHSMLHRYLPALSSAELRSEVADSKKALEDCIGAPVTGFIPPFNRPMHYPMRGAISVTEVLGLMGRGRGRQSLPSLFRALSQAGYRWSRCSFENKLAAALRKLPLGLESRPQQPFQVQNLVAIPLHATGFGEHARGLVRQYLDSGLVLATYGHPNQAMAGRDEDATRLREFLETFAAERASGRLSFVTMGEVASSCGRQASAA